MEAWERIEFLIEHLGLNKNSFSKEVGFNNNGTIGRIINEKRNPSLDTINKIIKRFPQISYDWIRLGIGDVEKQKAITPDVKLVYESPFMSVPFVPVSARAGYLRGYGDQEYIDSLSTIPCFVDKNYRGKYRVFEVEGDSMENRSFNEYFLDGDKILCREVAQHLWASKLHYRDYFFVIVHKTEGILLKEIINHSTETCDITCHSLNPMFDDFVLNLSEVSELYNVHKLVDRMIRK